MKVRTTRFGELDVKKEEIFFFKNGIFGFENLKKFILLKEESSMFSWLQSIESGELAFVLIKPIDFYYNYILDIDLPDANDLKIEDDDVTEIYAIVVIPDDTSKMTANLQGPIILNLNKKVGKQVVSLNPSHLLKHNILEELHFKTRKESSSSEGVKE